MPFCAVGRRRQVIAPIFPSGPALKLNTVVKSSVEVNAGGVTRIQLETGEVKRAYLERPAASFLISAVRPFASVPSCVIAPEKAILSFTA